MKTRAITGAIFVLVMLASVLLGPLVFSGFYFVLALACLYEFYGIFSSKESENQGKEGFFVPHRRLGMVLGFLGLLLLMLLQLGYLSKAWLALLGLLLPILLILQLYRMDANPFGRMACTLLGFVYVLLPFYCFYRLGFVGGTFQGALPMGFLLIL